MFSVIRFIVYYYCFTSLFSVWKFYLNDTNLFILYYYTMVSILVECFSFFYFSRKKKDDIQAQYALLFGMIYIILLAALIRHPYYEV